MARRAEPTVVEFGGTEQTDETVDYGLDDIIPNDEVQAWMDMPKPATEWPALRGFIDRMRARPSFKVLCEREALTEWLA